MVVKIYIFLGLTIKSQKSRDESDANYINDNVCHYDICLSLINDIGQETRDNRLSFSF